MIMVAHWLSQKLKHFGLCEFSQSFYGKQQIPPQLLYVQKTVFQTAPEAKLQFCILLCRQISIKFLSGQNMSA